MFDSPQFQHVKPQHLSPGSPRKVFDLLFSLKNIFKGLFSLKKTYLMCRRSSKGVGARIESLEDFTAKFGLNTSAIKSSEGQRREGSNNNNNNNNEVVKQEETADFLRRRGNKGSVRESSTERRKSSIQ